MHTHTHTLLQPLTQNGSSPLHPTSRAYRYVSTTSLPHMRQTSVPASFPPSPSTSPTRPTQPRTQTRVHLLPIAPTALAINQQYFVFNWSPPQAQHQHLPATAPKPHSSKLPVNTIKLEQLPGPRRCWRFPTALERPPFPHATPALLQPAG